MLSLLNDVSSVRVLLETQFTKDDGKHHFFNLSIVHFCCRLACAIGFRFVTMNHPCTRHLEDQPNVSTFLLSTVERSLNDVER